MLRAMKLGEQNDGQSWESKMHPRRNEQQVMSDDGNDKPNPLLSNSNGQMFDKLTRVVVCCNCSVVVFTEPVVVRVG